MLIRRSDLPLERDPSGRFIPWLVALMVYLAALALVCAMAMEKVVARWDSGLSGNLTVQIPAPEQAQAAAPNGALDQAIEILLGTSGIIGAEVLEPDEIAALLEPWLGSGAAYGDLPLPTLITVSIDPAAPADTAELQRRLSAATPGTVVDDHQTWLGRLRDLARSIEAVAALVVLLVGASAVAMVVFATRMGLAIHGQVIELLHLIGAQDSYVAREFESHALKLALRGGALGLLLAALTLVLAAGLIDPVTVTLAPDLSLRPLEWALLAALPLAVGLIAMLTARVTVLRTLGRLP